MEPLIREITDFKSLQINVQSSESNIFDSTKRYYHGLGKKLGLESKKDFEAEVEGVQLPAVAVTWLDAGKPLAAFTFCFGSKEEMLAAIFSLLSVQAELSVIITSSKAKNYSLEELKKIIEEPVFLNITTRFLLVDIAKEALSRKSGARGLRAILEKVMLDTMYELPSLNNVRECVISEEVIIKGEQNVGKNENDAK